MAVFTCFIKPKRRRMCWLSLSHLIHILPCISIRNMFLYNINFIDIEYMSVWNIVALGCELTSCMNKHFINMVSISMALIISLVVFHIFIIPGCHSWRPWWISDLSSYRTNSGKCESNYKHILESNTFENVVRLIPPPCVLMREIIFFTVTL